jgi:hypothetical protein
MMSGNKRYQLLKLVIRYLSVGCLLFTALNPFATDLAHGQDEIDCREERAYFIVYAMNAEELALYDSLECAIIIADMNFGVMSNFEFKLDFQNMASLNLRGAWLRGASAGEIDFSGSDLSEADLDGAFLLRTNFTGSILRGTSLKYIFAEEAIFVNADLTYSRLLRANLVNADLRYANLFGASLDFAQLSNADLTGANLTEARVDLGAHFDEGTILPDGLLWTSETDMGRYTNPSHPEYEIVRETIRENWPDDFPTPEWLSA